jgi:hypothetical protein
MRLVAFSLLLALLRAVTVAAAPFLSSSQETSSSSLPPQQLADGSKRTDERSPGTKTHLFPNDPTDYIIIAGGAAAGGLVSWLTRQKKWFREQRTKRPDPRPLKESTLSSVSGQSVTHAAPPQQHSPVPVADNAGRPPAEELNEALRRRRQEIAKSWTPLQQAEHVKEHFLKLISEDFDFGMCWEEVVRMPGAYKVVRVYPHFLTLSFSLPSALSSRPSLLLSCC